MENQQNFTLHNGFQFPKIGLGTSNSETFEKSLKNAIKLGYRHIDTASFYQNEDKIGNVLQQIFKETDLKREDFIITSKFWNNEKNEIQNALQNSLQKLQLSYIDIYLIHWPGKIPLLINYMKGGYFDEQNNFLCTPVHKIWPQMEEFVKQGLVKEIGISNFNVQMITDLMSYAKIQPSINQVELHPYLQQRGLVKCCKYFKILVVAYSPLCRGGKREKNGVLIDIFQEKIIQDLATKYTKTGSQIILNWHLQNGVAVIPRSENDQRLQENLDSSSFQMQTKDYEEIYQLERNLRMVLSEQKLFFDYFA